MRLWSARILLFAVLWAPLWADSPPVYLKLTPTPDSYLPGTLVQAADGSLYLGGTLSGGPGLLKVDTAGNVTLFSADTPSNLCTVDSAGLTLFSIIGSSGTHLLKRPLGAGAATTVPLTPSLGSYLTGTLVMGKDENLYVAGTSSDNVSGIYKVAQDGAVTLLVSTATLGFEPGNQMTADPGREKIFLQSGGTLRTVSMADGSVEGAAPLSPMPFSYALGDFAATADGRVFAIGQLSVVSPNALLSIGADGAVAVFDGYSNGTLVAGQGGKALYLVETVAGGQAPAGAPAAFKSGGQDVRVRKYQLVPESSSSITDVPPSRVVIQGGAKGYANPDKGEAVRVHFTPAAAGIVTVKIYTLNGRLVWETHKQVATAQDSVDWGCRNDASEIVSSGIYLVKVEGPGIDEVKKVAVVR